MQTAMTHTEVAIQNILVPTDFSSTSQRALRYAAAIARRYQSKIHLVHVIDRTAAEFLAAEMRSGVAEPYEDMRQAAQERLKHQARELTDVRHQIYLTDGAPSEVVEALVRENHIDLVVVGTHGPKVWEKLALGSTAEEIFRSATCPVLTVGPHARVNDDATGVNCILFPTVLASDASYALAHAISLAQRHDACLLLLHVLVGVQPPPDHEQQSFEKPYFNRLRCLIPSDVKLLRAVQYRVEYREPAADVIQRVAGEIAADLIVLSVRPKEPWATRLSAKAYRIVVGSVCPVLTVRERESA